MTSLNLAIVNSLKVYDAVKRFFRSNELPSNHLLSSLMESCGVMRGVKNGFETKLRDQIAPNLLDVDGDMCIMFIMPPRSLQKYLIDTLKSYIVIFITNLTNSNSQRT